VLVLWGWFIAQAPRLAGPRLTLHTAAAAHPALVAAAFAVGAVLVVVIPAFLLPLHPVQPSRPRGLE
jgi:hypothetical protein